MSRTKWRNRNSHFWRNRQVQKGYHSGKDKDRSAICTHPLVQTSLIPLELQLLFLLTFKPFDCFSVWAHSWPGFSTWQLQMCVQNWILLSKHHCWESLLQWYRFGRRVLENPRGKSTYFAYQQGLFLRYIFGIYGIRYVPEISFVTVIYAMSYVSLQY